MNPIFSHAIIGLSTLVLGVCVGYTISDRKKFNYQLVQNVCVAIISLLAMTALLVGTQKYQDAAECQSLYNKRFTESLAERSRAADQERFATRKMIAEVLNPQRTPETIAQAIKDWDTALAETDKKRENNPVPLPPGCIEGV